VRLASSERCKYSIHGHSYKYHIKIQDNFPLGENGMVIDFIDLKPVKDFIDKLDHATVLWYHDELSFKEFFHNNCRRVIEMKKNTTAENMSRLVFRFVKDWLFQTYPNRKLTILEVKVWETETGCGIATSCDEEDILIYCHEAE
jgi:6-pyruvoyltetrahydropterin/6-carboxytetrahydropterin synthase